MTILDTARVTRLTHEERLLRSFEPSLPNPDLPRWPPLLAQDPAGSQGKPIAGQAGAAGGALSGPAPRVNVIIVPDVPSKPTEQYSDWYWMLYKWGELYVQNAPAGEKRDIVKVPVTKLTKDRAADLTSLRSNILAAYTSAVGKQNKGGGQIIHALGHGVTSDTPGTGTAGMFDLGSQIGGFSTHLLVASSATFLVNKGQRVTKNSKELTKDQYAEEKELYTLLQNIGKEIQKGGSNTTCRIVTCSIGSAPDFLQDLADLWGTLIQAYTVHVGIAYDKSQTKFEIGFFRKPSTKSDGSTNWEENAGTNLPTTHTESKTKNTGP